jgi:hypothetical protein
MRESCEERASNVREPNEIMVRRVTLPVVKGIPASPRPHTGSSFLETVTVTADSRNAGIMALHNAALAGKLFAVRFPKETK